MLFCVAGGINFVLGPMTNKSSGVTQPGKPFLLICQKNKRNASTNRSSLKNQECKNKLIHRCLSTMLQACAFLQCCFPASLMHNSGAHPHHWSICCLLWWWKQAAWTMPCIRHVAAWVRTDLFWSCGMKQRHKGTKAQRHKGTRFHSAPPVS